MASMMPSIRDLSCVPVILSAPALIILQMRLCWRAWWRSWSGKEQTVFTVGDTVELNGVKTTLLSAEEYPGKQYMMPTDGNVFLVCQFEIENDSSAEINVSSMVSFNAYCDDYSVNLSVTGEMLEDSWKSLDGTVAPGKKINGVIAYEIPQDWQKMEISYTPSFWSGHDVQFEINK